MLATVSLVVHNVRSAHNVGSLLRSADGLGVEAVYLTGYTPYPAKADDVRLPHLSGKIDRQIKKTALGAEKSVRWQQVDDVMELIGRLKTSGYKVLALEQTPASADLTGYKPAGKSALIVGSEIGGLGDEVLSVCDQALEIPMHGQKESFNVAVAAAIALYHLLNLA